MPAPRLTVSVLMSTFNRADLLPEALDSLLNQTRPPDEIVVVDDGSTDNTPEVLARYPMVTVIRQVNQGLPVGRNVGMRAATGDLIAFLDSDDVLPPESIQRRAEFLEAHPDVQAVYSAAYMTDMQNKVLGWFRPPPLPRGWIFAEAACRPVFPMHTIMLRRACIAQVGYFDEALRVCLDFDYWMRFTSLFALEAIDEPLAYYRVHDAMSIVAQSDEVRQKELLVRERAFAMPAFARLTPKEKARVYSVHGTQLLLDDQPGAARRWYGRALASAPTWPRPYLLLGMSLLGKRGVEMLGNLRRQQRGEVNSSG